MLYLPPQYCSFLLLLAASASGKMDSHFKTVRSLLCREGLMMKAQANRQDYVDWLRVGAMFLLLFYHSGRLFDEPAWHIKNAALNFGIEAFNRFLDIWHMPLFFMLAGASVWFSLGSRTPGGFTKERVLRLFVPLVFGMLIIVPPQVYTERIYDGDFSGSFLAWYPHTFFGTYSMESAASGNLSWHHLWFLAYLFVFALILLPVLGYFKKESRKPVISAIAGFLEKPGAIFLPALILIIINITLRPIYGWGNQNLISDWANFLFYLTVFFYGFMLVSDSRIMEVVRRDTLAALIVAAISSVGIIILREDILPLPGAVILTFYAVACWAWLLVIFGVGSRLLNFTNRLLKYANNAVLPVYVLHQTIIVTLGFYIIKWDTGVAAKYLAVVFVTLVGSLAIYEMARRTRVTQFLFGMKFKRPSRA
jgi:glucans biosynthesis protein C